MGGEEFRRVGESPSLLSGDLFFSSRFCCLEAVHSFFFFFLIPEFLLGPNLLPRAAGEK